MMKKYEEKILKKKAKHENVSFIALQQVLTKLSKSAIRSSSFSTRIAYKSISKKQNIDSN